MTTQVSSVEDKDHTARAPEVFIRLTLLAIMGVSCVVLLRPFLKIIISGIVIAIAVYPGYRMLTRVLRGRKKSAAALCSVLLLIVVILPSVLLTGTLVDEIRTIAHKLQAGQINIPPPSPGLEKLPIIGASVREVWTLCSTNLSEAVAQYRPVIQKYIPVVLAASAGLGGVVFQFLLSVLLAGFLLANSEGSARFADRVFARIFGDQGREYEELVTSTVRSVTNGILGVAVIQTFFASLGFWFIGLPGADLWALIFLVAAILQIGAIVLLPAVLYVFATSPTSPAVLFAIWSIIVGLMDNLLKPLLLGRGSKVPMLVIFLGVLGGFVAMRIVGLFVGAIVLSVGYKLFIAWVNAGTPALAATPTSATKAA